MEFIIGVGIVIFIISMIPAIKKLITIGITRLEHDEDLRYGERCYKAGIEHQKKESEKKD